MTTALRQLCDNLAASPVCAGVDPDISKIPPGGKSPEDRIYSYLTAYIDTVAPHICAFKAQKAFFDLHAGGHDLLESVAKYVHERHPGLPFILDCKVGDIGNTMAAYISNIFGNLKCDGLLLNPYMGDDVFEAAAEHKDKAVGVLCKTSNPGAEIVQDQPLKDGTPLWLRILDLSMTRWNKGGNIFPVISAADPALLSRARGIVPRDTPILFAGVGAQGRDAAAVRFLLNDAGSGVFVNSSRGLMYPETRAGEDLAAAMTRAVTDLKTELQGYRT